VIRLDVQIVGDFVHWERRGPSQQLRERAVVLRVEMLHEYEAHTRVEWQMLQERRERLEPAGGGPDAHDRERPACT
jgi:hypothetical protein